MPTGVAKLGQSVSEQNALMISTLLMPHGIKVGTMTYPNWRPIFSGLHPVIHGMPPYGYWEHLPTQGRLPPNRTEVGAYLLAEVIGARQCIYVKDVNGLYEDNPKLYPEAKFIPKIGVRELQAMNLDDLVVEWAVLDMLARSRSVKQIQIINGLIPGNISRALKGEHVGTIIYNDQEN